MIQRSHHYPGVITSGQQELAVMISPVNMLFAALVRVIIHPLIFPSLKMKTNTKERLYIPKIGVMWNLKVRV